MEQDHQEMQLLSYSSTPQYPLPWPSQSPSVDLQLSISVGGPSVEALKREAAEQIRLAGMEKAYAEHVMEMSRREMEVAQTEFMRARSLWERAREEVQRAHKLRERAAAMEITCLSCRHKFRPN
ncbi:protein indeterminate-domain 16-like [Salvia hispanica]|uniref:protein indeterminate-domain 16-like n=1 Tax=Salvia hispanica TaxID=49212 RepID=UPI00200974AC|nr:protein indeterminate-domain 16-like [Salvia hispanica]